MAAMPDRTRGSANELLVVDLVVAVATVVPDDVHAIRGRGDRGVRRHAGRIGQPQVVRPRQAAIDRALVVGLGITVIDAGAVATVEPHDIDAITDGDYRWTLREKRRVRHPRVG